MLGNKFDASAIDFPKIKNVKKKIAGPPISKVIKKKDFHPEHKEAFAAVKTILKELTITPELISILDGPDDLRYFYIQIKLAYKDKEEQFNIPDTEGFFSYLNDCFCSSNQQLKYISAKVIAFFISYFSNHVDDMTEFCAQRIDEEPSQIILLAMIQNFPTFDSNFIEYAFHMSGKYLGRAIEALVDAGIDIPDHRFAISKLIETGNPRMFSVISAMCPTNEEMNECGTVDAALSILLDDKVHTQDELDIIVDFLSSIFLSEGENCTFEIYQQLVSNLEQAKYNAKRAIVSLLRRILIHEKPEMIEKIIDMNLAETISALLESVGESLRSFIESLLIILVILLQTNKDKVIESCDDDLAETLNNMLSEYEGEENIINLAQKILSYIE